MRVALPIPTSWLTRATEEGFVSHGESPDPRLFASRLSPLPPLVSRAWAERLVAAHLPAGHELAVREARDAESRRGWPVTIFRAEVHDPGGALVEHRTAVLYRFIHVAGTAELWSASPAIDPLLLARLLDGAPDLTGTVACLAHILER